MRFAISPAAPAATSRSARPPSTSSGTGSDDGLDEFRPPAIPLSPLRPDVPVVVVSFVVVAPLALLLLAGFCAAPTGACRSPTFLPAFLLPA